MFENLSKSYVLSAILSKFGSQKECAKALNITQATLSRNLERLTEKFILRLIDAGVELAPFKFEVKEPFSNYGAEHQLKIKSLLDEIRNIKAELFDIIKRLETLEGK